MLSASLRIYSNHLFIAIMDHEHLKYPIGKFNPVGIYEKDYLLRRILEIETLPIKLQNIVNKLDQKQLDTPYRPGGWTVRQLVHHLPDSHANAYIRFKWTLTEENPTIKAYKEDLWAELPDSKAPVYVAFNMLSSIHERWVILMRSLSEAEWERSFIHPETKKTISLRDMAGLYAWHGIHHLAHIHNLIVRERW